MIGVSVEEAAVGLRRQAEVARKYAGDIHYNHADGHFYQSPVDDPEHLDVGDIDQYGRCAHQDNGSTCPEGCGRA